MTESRSATKMTVNFGIRKILPSSDICGFEFDPCAYSMNSIEGADLSTIHVTPEDGFSYASLEAVEYYLKCTSLGSLVERVLACIQPDEFSIALHVAVACKLLQGYSLAEWTPEEFGKGGLIVYLKFTRCWKEEKKEEKE
ncbi:hypothetical protein RND71_008669 [Anisodus tanguticus]|uniref:S-adenosylmethionine decarboxylase proenzyme n=1 Tax=Anisodus tanguticus TaxID=243964 RepID=A0AAE1VUF8_9SOLA|nr:hypothetical protein RND71_008669 [Anisodus tanguticus]